MAGMAYGKMKGKEEELKRALKCLMGGHQRMILATMLRHIDFLAGEIKRLDEEIKGRMRPFEEQVIQLDAITG